jgi:hypothetical protein
MRMKSIISAGFVNTKRGKTGTQHFLVLYHRQKNEN